MTPERPASPVPTWLTRLQPWLLPLVLLLTLGAYLPALQHGLVWDDHFLLTDDPRVTGPLQLAALLSPYWQSVQAAGGPAYTRPLVTLSFALQHGLTGLNPLPLHAFNVGIHLLNGLLLWHVLARLVGASSGPGAKSGPGASSGFRALWRSQLVWLYLVYPLQVEPVAWIAGRTDLLAMSFGLLSLLLLPLPSQARVHETQPTPDEPGAGPRLLLLGCGLFGCLLAGLLSKEVGLAFAALSLWWSLKVALPPRTSLAVLVSTVGALVVWYSLRQLALLDGSPEPLASPDPGLPPLLLVSLRVITSVGLYLKLLSWPWNPSALPAMRGVLSPDSPFFWMGLLGSLGLLSFLLCAVWDALRSANARSQASSTPTEGPEPQPLPLLTLGGLWIGLGLLPVLNLVPLSAPSPVAERFWYVPLGGVCLVLSAGLERWWDSERVPETELEAVEGAAQHRLSWRAGRFLPTGLLLTGLLLTGLLLGLVATGVSQARVHEWHSDRTLWEAEAQRHGLRHVLTARNLGVARRNDGELGGAMLVWQEAWSRGLGRGSEQRLELGLLLLEGLQKQEQQGEADAVRKQLQQEFRPGQLTGEQLQRLLGPAIAHPGMQIPMPSSQVRVP